MVAIAWQHVLAHAPEEDCRAIAGHDQAIEARERASIASRLQTIVRELATAGMTPAEVAAQIASDHLPMSTRLWDAIDRMRRAMLSVLDEAGLDEPETARAELLATGNVFVDGWTHLWVVAADPAPRERALLDAIETHGVSVTSLIHGDEAKLGEAFSETGVIDREWWTRAKVAFDTNTIHTCDSVPDQVAVVLSCLANAGEVDPTKVSIVVPDASLGPLLHRGTRAEGVHVHLADGQSSATGRIGSLLTALHACLVSDDAAVWGDLLRHPDIEHLAPMGAIAKWDALWAAHLPRDLTMPPPKAKEKYEAIVDPMRDVLKPLLAQVSAPASAWAAPICVVLNTIIQERPNGSGEDAAVLEFVQTHLQALHEMPVGAIEIPAHIVIGALVQALQAASIPADRHPDAMDCIGWLDAHLDDAPLCILTGLNEGMVPAAPSTDPWLPEGLRAAVGLSTAKQRFARDAWLLHATMQSGRRVELIVPRRGTEGDPLLPSRLLLGERGEELARRTLALIKPTKAEQTIAARQSSSGVDCVFDEKPIPAGPPFITGVSVTTFKTYFNDPLAFLLRQDRRIRSRDVCVQGDLDNRGFGNFLHLVVEHWGRDECNRTSPTTCVQTIEEHLLKSLEAVTAREFGPRLRPGVRLQRAIAVHRLRVFAQHQGAQAAAGWKVKHLERSWGNHHDCQAPALQLGSGAGLPLSGRIDRIDEHPELGLMAIDYKSGTKVLNPDKTHRNKAGEWIDLQLPLYAALMKSSGMHVDGRHLGYVLLAPADELAGFHMATFTQADLDDAESEAASVIDIIQEGQLMQIVQDWCDR
jgi:hypothetical protein